ncbi:MAG: hypothetical protein Q4D55_12085, partial [Eubacteriales bacterium]|nr:hypothetical protein [Eubacteriales bacterium]
MEIKLSDRDKKLLLFLAIFLMAVGFGKLVILPGIKNYQKLDMEITDRQLEKDEMEMTIIGYPMLEGEYEELKAQADEVYEDYYPVMNSQEIDRRITGIVLEAGVEAVSLQIDMADQQGLSLGKYDGLEVMPQGEGSEETEPSPDGEEAQE